MSELKSTSLDRRGFLKGAAGIAGAVALSCTPRAAKSAALGETAQSAAAAEAAKQPVSVAFWDGARLRDAGYVAADPALAHSPIRVGVAPSQSSLAGLNAHYLVALQNGDTHIPYHAWRGGSPVQFTMPVHPYDGVLLSVEHDNAETYQRLGFGNAQIPLRSGVYVFAAGSVNWAAYRMETDQTGSLQLMRRSLKGIVPAEVRHLLVSVDPA